MVLNCLNSCQRWHMTCKSHVLLCGTSDMFVLVSSGDHLLWLDQEDRRLESESIPKYVSCCFEFAFKPKLGFELEPRLVPGLERALKKQLM